MKYFLLGLSLFLVSTHFIGAQNLLLNPGFQDWIGDSICNYWEKETGGFSVLKDSSWSYYTARLILRSTETQRFIQRVAPITPGHSYEGSFYCWDCDLNIKIRLFIRWFNGSGNPIDSFWSGFTMDTVPCWQELRAGPDNAPAMAETAHFEIRLYEDNYFIDSAVILVDDASFIDLSGVDEHPPKSETHQNRISLFPNPFKTVTKIQLLDAPKNTKSIICIYDISGRLIKSVKLEAYSHQLGADLVPGVYFLKLTAEEHEEIQKLIKIR